MTRLGLIFARARNGVIGQRGAMPWHLPEDLAHFKKTTMGTPVIMGRKTWDSLPQPFRPLPGRRNIVVTRDPDWRPRIDAADVLRAASIEQAVQCCGDTSEAWVIGGAELLRAALPLASRAVLTEIDADFDGDTVAPELGAGWTEISREPHLSESGLRFCFVHYLKSEQGNPADGAT
ncbi:MAG: dihydrofolate reductase [Burkholderiales bacterium]